MGWSTLPSSEELQSNMALSSWRLYCILGTWEGRGEGRRRDGEREGGGERRGGERENGRWMERESIHKNNMIHVNTKATFNVISHHTTQWSFYGGQHPPVSHTST